MIQDPKQLIDLVERMREAQVRYHQRRTQSDLTRAKNLEREVDNWIRAWRMRQKAEQQQLIKLQVN